MYSCTAVARCARQHRAWIPLPLGRPFNEATRAPWAGSAVGCAPQWSQRSGWELGIEASFPHYCAGCPLTMYASKLPADPLVLKYSPGGRPGDTARRLQFAPSSPQHPSMRTWSAGRQSGGQQLILPDETGTPERQGSEVCTVGRDEFDLFVRRTERALEQIHLGQPATTGSSRRDTHVSYLEMARRLTSAESAAAAAAAKLESVEVRCGWLEEQLREHAALLRVPRTSPSQVSPFSSLGSDKLG